MLTLQDNIDKCLSNRQTVINCIVRVLSGLTSNTEQDIASKLNAAIYSGDFFSEGWYAPPPHGTAVLLDDGDQNFARSKFPTLRTQDYWPTSTYSLNDETVGMIYVSPVSKPSGIIGDIGITLYRGENSKIRNHLTACLEATEAIAEHVKLGMKFNGLFDLAEKTVKEHGLQNAHMVTFNDPTGGADYGHTVPWSDQLYTPEEEAILSNADGNFQALSTLLSRKRHFINPVDDFLIRENCAFSIEPRLLSLDDKSLPCGYFYTYVIFKNGEKKIISNFNPVFKSFNMEYIRSTY